MGFAASGVAPYAPGDVSCDDQVANASDGERTNVSRPIEDYALVGDLHTGALISRGGSVDWLCLPRFDSPACFAALLGDEENGHWTISPQAGGDATARGYRGDTLVLESEWTTPDGVVRVVDFMPPRDDLPDLVRVVEGVSGRVPMRSTLRIRFDYGHIVPWVRRVEGQLCAVAGPDALWLRSPVESRGVDKTTISEFTVTAGDRLGFSLTWHPSHEPKPRAVDALKALKQTEKHWTQWISRVNVEGPYREAVIRSLITLKALTYSPTGGIAAAATTSLPEQLGGDRNWDYRYCWLRDATMTLHALLSGGYHEEARAWRDWLLNAVAGAPDQVQIMYGIDGERRLTEFEVPWLPGYEESRPVRVGNAAHAQLQLDVYGEVMDALYQARIAGLAEDRQAWAVQVALTNHVMNIWREPDFGIWEVRGPTQHFTHSKLMCWVALDRSVKSIEQFSLEGPLEEWRTARQAIHDDICANAWDARRSCFVQAYGSSNLDASTLLIPLVGFLPADDPRVRGTVECIERGLMVDGLVMRYDTGRTEDGLPPGEGAFLACSCWLADCYAMLGRRDDAVALFERLRGLANDVGLLSEEYDSRAQRFCGNFPQAFSHIALVNTAFNLSRAVTQDARKPAEQRGK